jgi:hypothetical protein
MGTARDRSPDPTRTTNWARPPFPARPRLHPVSTPESRMAPRRRPEPSGPRGTASTPSSPASPPFGRQPKMLDRLRDAHLARHYSPRTERGRAGQDAAQGCEGSAAEAPRSRALDPSGGPGGGIWW